MKKIFAYLATLIGVLLILPLLDVNLGVISPWVISLAVLAIGIIGIAEK